MFFMFFFSFQSAELTEASADRIKSKLIKPQKVVGTAMWIIFAVGCLLIVGGLFNIIRTSRQDRSKTFDR